METEGMKVAEWFWAKCVERNKKGRVLRQPEKLEVLRETEKAVLTLADVYQFNGVKTDRQEEVWVPKKCIVNAEEEAAELANAKEREKGRRRVGPSSGAREEASSSQDVPF